MSLDLRLGGMTHNRAMSSIKNDLLSLAYHIKNKSFMKAQDLYTEEYNKQYIKHSFNPDIIPLWVVRSKANQALEAYVRPNYHIRRYQNEM